ncbi:PREDICTED: uncharacterized protein LOC104600412 [Nelumbo nucifera]|nr:PREDICTED: uncharacterized protein LOC104600412 [Nelumbo nucifera]
MAKFNETQKMKRAQAAERKRAIHGDPVTRKLKNKPQPLSMSGKRKRKLFKKWRREQKEALQKGIVSMEDIEMAVAEGSSQEAKKEETKFRLKKSAKLQVKQLKRKGKKKGKSSKPAEEAPVDAMVE